MDVLFLMLMLISIVALIIALIKPIFFQKIFTNKANRKNLSLYFIGSFIVFSILFWITTPPIEEVTEIDNRIVVTEKVLPIWNTEVQDGWFNEVKQEQIINDNDVNSAQLEKNDNLEEETLGEVTEKEQEEIGIETLSQKNAIIEANLYLNKWLSWFSRDWLIEQLEYEWFSNKDASYAADKLNINWDRQAEIKIDSYLRNSSLSRVQFIRQLEYEWFTSEQYLYILDKTDIDWNMQAEKKAKSYLNKFGSSRNWLIKSWNIQAEKKVVSYLGSSGFSRSWLIKRLEFESFTPEQSISAVDKTGIDWNIQAEKKAKYYLINLGFSRSWLIKQLIEFEGFTPEQAIYWVDAIGL